MLNINLENTNTDKMAYHNFHPVPNDINQYNQIGNNVGHSIIHGPRQLNNFDPNNFYNG